METSLAILTLLEVVHSFLEFNSFEILHFHTSLRALLSFGPGGTRAYPHGSETMYIFQWVAIEFQK